MEEIKILANEKYNDTKKTAENSTIGEFLLKTHEETFSNLGLISHELATVPVKRYVTLTAESDGIDLILKVGGNLLYKDAKFKDFIVKMNDFFNKIKSDPDYQDVEEYKYNEELVYDKFKDILSKINENDV